MPPFDAGAEKATVADVVPVVVAVPIVGAPGTVEMVIVNEEVAAVPVYGESVTVTTIAEDPATVGVPEISPVDELRVNPLGSVPVVTANDFVPAPPGALRLSEYAELTGLVNPLAGVVMLIWGP